MNEHPKKRKRKTLHPSRYSGQSRAWVMYTLVSLFFLRIITLWEGTICANTWKISNLKGGIRTLGLNVLSTRSACSIVKPLPVNASEQFCSVLPANGETCSSCKMEMILLTHKGRNFVKVGMGVSRSVHRWTKCVPVTVLSGSGVW